MSDAVLRFTGVDAGLSAQFARALSQLKQLNDSADKTSGAINKGFQVAAGAVAAISFTQLAKEAFELAEQLEIASARTGIQVEALQQLQFVAGQSETSIDAITTSINKFQVNLATGNDKAIKSLKDLGISIAEINSLSPDQQFLRIAEAVAEIQSPAERAATAVNLFGKGGTELLPLLRKGADGIKEVSAQFDQLGVSLSKETIQKLDDAGDAVSRMTGSVKALSAELISLASPAIVGATDAITTFFKAVAFGLRGEGGGHGENAIANLDQDIGRVREQIALLGSPDAASGGFFDWFAELGGQSRKNDELARLNAELRALIHNQEILTGTGAGGISPISAIDTSILGTAGVQKPRLPEQPLVLTPQDIREGGGLGESDPTIIRALTQKDLELQINQEKVDEILKQESALADGRVKLYETGNARLLSLTEAFSGQLIDMEQFKNDFIVDSNMATATLLGEVTSSVFAKNKSVAIGMATISTLVGITNALRDYPWPYNLIVGAAVAAQGFAQVQRIKSTSHKGGGGGFSGISAGGVSAAGNESVRSSSSGLDTAQPGATQKPQTNITVYGWDERVIRELVRRITDEVGDHDLNLIRN